MLDNSSEIDQHHRDSAHDQRILYAENTDASGERRTAAPDEIIT